MIKANLNFNYYFPFYTIRSFGKKKYSHTEMIVMHLSRERRFVFKMFFDSGKLSEIEFDHEKQKSFDYFSKDVKQIPYVDFALKMKSFENFLKRGLNNLLNEPPYYKTMVFPEVYKFNRNMELSFSYGKLRLRKGSFLFSIEDGKLKKPNKEYGKGDLDKVEKYLDAWDSNYKFKQIEEAQFNKDLNNVMSEYIKFLSAPIMLRKNEYTEKNLP